MAFNSIIKKIKGTQSTLTTYHMGLVQAKAFRMLQQRTNIALEPYGITSIDWALLGLLYEHELESADGMRYSKVASALGVEPPFVTALVDGLDKKGLVAQRPIEHDKRAKALVLTPVGTKFVDKTEKLLRSKMRYLIRGLSIRDLWAYIRVLKEIIHNEQNSHKD